MQREFLIPFRYPEVYKPKSVINGLKESVLSVITMKDTTKIDYAIWGLLPEKYSGDWSVFQEYTNSLTVEYNGQSNDFVDVWYTNSTIKRRCLIIVTGFYVSNIKDGKISTYYITHPNKLPFGLAGVYNEIEDGFITCAVVTAEIKSNYSKKQNLGKNLPVAIQKNQIDKWLDPKATASELDNIIRSSSSECHLIINT